MSPVNFSFADRLKRVLKSFQNASNFYICNIYTSIIYLNIESKRTVLYCTCTLYTILEPRPLQYNKMFCYCTCQCIKVMIVGHLSIPPYDTFSEITTFGPHFAVALMSSICIIVCGPEERQHSNIRTMTKITARDCASYGASTKTFCFMKHAFDSHVVTSMYDAFFSAVLDIQSTHPSYPSRDASLLVIGFISLICRASLVS